MKIIDYLFFGIYNSYYKDGNYKNDIPWYTAMMIFAAIFFLNVSCIMVLLSTRKGYPVSTPIGFLVGGACVLISYFLFVWKKRYQHIYNSFSVKDRRQRLANRVVSWAYVGASIILFMLLPLRHAIEK